MGSPYKNIHRYLDQVPDQGVIVEIGSERGDGSTADLAQLARQHGLEFHTVDITTQPQQWVDDPSINWHVMDGATWCERVYPTIARPIAVLYLDNFDWIYDESTIDLPVWNADNYQKLRGPSWPQQFDSFDRMPDRVQQEVLDMTGVTMAELHGGLRGRYLGSGYQLSNVTCQIEHMRQLLALFRYFVKGTVIAFDDTMLASGARATWQGKCGPGVVFLQAHGYTVMEHDRGGVIMKKLT